MPENKGYIFRDIFLYGNLPPEFRTVRLKGKNYKNRISPNYVRKKMGK